MTLFLALVVAGFATFMLVLGFVSIRNYVDDLRTARAAAARGKAGTSNRPTTDDNAAPIVSSPSCSDEHHSRQATRSLVG